MTLLPNRVHRHIKQLSQNDLPAYVYDLKYLDGHARRIRNALPDKVQLFYATKANNDSLILQTLAEIVDGFEVSSGGEIIHVQSNVPNIPLAFGAPGKTLHELHAAVELGVGRVHVESRQEIEALASIAAACGRSIDVLLRVNLPIALMNVALSMGGLPSPFGFDAATIEDAVSAVEANEYLNLRGIHAHLASGLDALSAIDVASVVINFTRALVQSTGVKLLAPLEINVGGGMEVNYNTPTHTFNWEEYGAGLDKLIDDDITIRIEPGRAVTVYCGWYATKVLDVRESYGETFAIVQGGTHHLRTPVAKGHNQPFDVLPTVTWKHSWPRPVSIGKSVTITGQLCTPKDVLSRRAQVEQLRANDIVVFSMTGAYAWNISHQTFLMHPPPGFYYLT